MVECSGLGVVRPPGQNGFPRIQRLPVAGCTGYGVLRLRNYICAPARLVPTCFTRPSKYVNRKWGRG